MNTSTKKALLLHQQRECLFCKTLITNTELLLLFCSLKKVQLNSSKKLWKVILGDDVFSCYSVWKFVWGNYFPKTELQWEFKHPRK